jgi:hypothetical protein
MADVIFRRKCPSFYEETSNAGICVHFREGNCNWYENHACNDFIETANNPSGFHDLMLEKPKKLGNVERQPGMFPQSFNKLREVLYQEHHDLWLECGGMMIHNQEMFIEYMNEHLEQYMFMLTPPNWVQGIEYCCDEWLKALVKRPKCWRKR